MQEQLIAKKARFFVIDAYRWLGMPAWARRTNTILQVCFFAISKVLPRDEAIEAIRESIRDTYGKKGEEVVQKNLKAPWTKRLAHLFEVKLPEAATSTLRCRRLSWQERHSSSATFSGRSMPDMATIFLSAPSRCDGTFPTGTAKWEKRNIALEIPAWDTNLYPVRQVRDGLSPLRDPHQGIRHQRTGSRSRTFKVD